MVDVNIETISNQSKVLRQNQTLEGCAEELDRLIIATTNAFPIPKEVIRSLVYDAMYIGLNVGARRK